MTAQNNFLKKFFLVLFSIFILILINGSHFLVSTSSSNQKDDEKCHCEKRLNYLKQNFEGCEKAFKNFNATNDPMEKMIEYCNINMYYESICFHENGLDYCAKDPAVKDFLVKAEIYHTESEKILKEATEYAKINLLPQLLEQIKGFDETLTKTSINELVSKFPQLKNQYSKFCDEYKFCNLVVQNLKNLSKEDQEDDSIQTFNLDNFIKEYNECTNNIDEIYQKLKSEYKKVK